MRRTKQSGRGSKMRLCGALAAALLLLCALCAAAQTAPAKPAPAQQPSPDEANPFPGETNNVPVLPSTPEALAAQGDLGDAGEATPLSLPSSDADPVRSPDNPAAIDAVSASHGFSSSRSGLDSILPDPNAPDPRDRKKRRQAHEAPPHQETSAEDISVGKYYLDNKNWKGALSRFQSALVLAPEEPEVYWGLAESQRHIGDVANARLNYQKVIEYDPDSRHAKEAAKWLKSPELAATGIPLTPKP